MSSRNRYWYPGAQFHVVNRGNKKIDIFREEADFQIYLQMLLRVMEKYPFELCSFCLMRNHIHLQIQTKEHELWKIVHLLHTNYSKFFNLKYNETGHLFQGRYFAELVEDQYHALTVSRYIHLNPVKANIVTDATEYPWSSYSAYIGETDYKWLSQETILKYIGRDNPIEWYKHFMSISQATLPQSSQVTLP